LTPFFLRLEKKVVQMRRTVLVLASMALALLVASCVGLLNAVKPAEATFPGKNGKIASQGNGVIYAINPNGGGKTEVTEGRDPSYSSDGEKIAYSAFDGNDSEIYTIKATGGKPFQVTDNDTNDVEPTYSPGGKKIAYTCFFGRSDKADEWEICTIRATGGKPFQVTNNKRVDFLPSYSPNGKKIAYSGAHGRDFDIDTINARGGGKFNVTKDDTSRDFYPDYSPDGKKIAYSAVEVYRDGDSEERSLGDIYTVKAAGGKPFQVTNTYDKDDYDPSYSPNGKKIAYMSLDDSTSEYELYKVRATGGESFQITHGNYETGLDLSWGKRP
jgi:TolB protein